jgi:hypothetical protein
MPDWILRSFHLAQYSEGLDITQERKTEGSRPRMAEALQYLILNFNYLIYDFKLVSPRQGLPCG